MLLQITSSEPILWTQKLTGHNASLQIVGARNVEDVAVQGPYGFVTVRLAQKSCTRTSAYLKATKWLPINNRGCSPRNACRQFFIA